MEIPSLLSPVIETFKTVIGFMERHQGIFILGLGIVGYRNAKRTYMANIAPIIVLERIDTHEKKLYLRNIGKGYAQNIQLTNFVTIFPGGGSWTLQFKSPILLAPNDSKTPEVVGLVSGKRVDSPDLLFTQWFHKKQSPFPSQKRKKEITLVITYENIEGTRYVSSATIDGDEIQKILTRFDYPGAEFYRRAKSTLHQNYLRIKLWFKPPK